MKVVFPSRGRNPREETPRAGVGYVWVQHLPLKLALRERPELEDRPVILGGGVRKAATDGLVVDASDECLEAGVRVGQPLREAREYIPGASLLPANPSADSRAHEALLDLVGALATDVEDDGLGRAYFALDRPVEFADGRWLLAALRSLIRERLDFHSTRLALTPGKFAARIAAELDPNAADGTPILLDGEVAGYLEPFPVEVLFFPLPPRTLERLRFLGVSTVGEFARLPRDGIGRRLGPEAVSAHRLAHGEDKRPVVGRRRAESAYARWVLEPAVETAEPLLAAAEQLVARLAGEVGEQGKTFRALSVEVEYDAGGRAERTAELRRPAANLGQCSATLRMLVEAVLAVHVGPVAAVGVKLSALAPNRSEQLALFDKAQDRAERRLLLAAAAQEAERRYPARLHRVSPSELPTLLDEYQFSLLPYIPDERRPDPIGKAITSTPAAASTGVCRIERQNGRSYLVEAGRRDELLAVHGCWRAEEWWPKEIERVYWRLRTGSGRILTLARDDDGWRLVEVLD